MNKAYITYVLFSKTHDKHYTGYTSNLKERFLSHNILGKGWTSRYRPWKIIYTKEFKAKAEALKYEKWLKTGVGRSFINMLDHTINISL